MVSWRVDWPKYLALWVGVIISAFGAAVLFAWHAQFPLLVQVSSGLPPLSRQGALNYLLTGAALALLASGRKRAAAALVTVPFIVSAIVCAEYLLDRDLGVDQLLGKPYITEGPYPPGRMSQVVALWFLGSSVALLALSIRRLARYASAIAGIVASVLIAVSSVTFLAYLGRSSAYGWGHFKRVAIHGAAASVWLGLGIFALAVRESWLRKTLTRWLPWGIGLGLTAGSLGVWQALMMHERSQLPLLSRIILAGGILGAILVAFTVYQVQKATLRNRELQEGKAAYERLFEASLDALLVVDREGRILAVNERTASVFGYTREELLGSPIETLVPIDLRELHRVHREHYSVAPRTRPMGKGLELYGRRKDGSEFPVDVSLSPLQSRGELQVLAAVRDITERKRAEEALRQSEQRFRNVFERSPLGLALVHPDYRIMTVNESMRRMLGYAEGELDGMSLAELTHPEDREESKRLAQQLFEGEIPFYKTEKRYVKKNGEIMWASLTSTILRDRQGRLLYSLGMIEDITERKQAQEALLQSEERFRGVFENSPLGLALIGPDYRLVKVNPSLCRMSGYSEAELIALNPFDLTHPDDREQSMAVAQRLFNGEIPSYKLEKRYVRKNGEIMWATMTATILRDREGRPLFGLGMVEDITARKQAQEALRQSEERFRQIVEQGPIGITLMGRDYRFVKVNAALCRMLGYSEAELSAMTPLEFTYRDDRQTTVELTEQLFKTEIPVHQEKRYVKKSGEIIWGSLTASVVHDQQGRPLYGMGMIEDITERKRAEEELRTQSERLSLATKIASIGVWDWDLRTNLEVWDDAAFEMFGLPKVNPVRTEDFVACVHPDDLARLQAVNERVIRGKTQESMEFRILRTDGSLRHLLVAEGAVPDERGNVVRMVGIGIDITERKRAEEELRTLSERLSQAIRFASMSVWEWDPRTNLFLWDDAAFAIAGIPKVCPLTYEQFARTVHPENLPRAEAALQRVFREKTHESLEFRVIRPDGGLRHVYAAGGPILDRQGNVARVVGIAVDITERKRVEDELRALTQRLSLAARSAFIGVWDWDRRTDLAIWDDRMFEIFGISKKPGVTHEDWASRIHPADLPIVEAHLARAVNSKTQYQVDFRFVRPDGSLGYVSGAGGPVVDENGNVTGVVGIAIDITERKRLEAELETAREQAITAARLSALGMMAGGIAHEINNPLSIIHAMSSDLAEMVEEGGSAPPEVVARKSAIIRETSERIAKIVRSLRQISREGSTDLFHPTPLAKILTETLEICRAKFRANSVDLLVPQTIPELSVPCREVQIAQALLNLLQNAFDAVVEQEGERWVRLELKPRDTVVAISVIDSGPGVPSELRSRIGEPFFTTKPVGKGTGLGLSLSKTIAEDHGGRLEYGEECGHTRFSLILPLARKAEAA